MEDIIILVDENGVEQEYEVLDTVEFDGDRYVVLIQEDDDEVSDDDKSRVKKEMLVLNSDGDVQMRLQGGERLFSRIFTRKLIK